MASTRFARIAVRAPDAAAAERAAAEAFAAGASGLEERADALLIYAPLADAEAVRTALAAAGLAPGPAEPEPEVDWSQAWRAGLAPLVVSPRLAIVPAGERFRAAPGQALLTIEVAQAFGTGGHASTRLLLEALAALPEAALAGRRVLDVGSGTGVLALAALRLGAERALAFDTDPLAARATRDNARANGLAPRVAVFCGATDALGAAHFELVLANLLRRELLPLLPALAAALAPGGLGLLSGLLGAERPEVERACGEVGLRVAAESEAHDADGERWIALRITR